MAAEENKKGADGKSFLQKLAETEKYRRGVLALGLVGIALVFFSGFLKNDSVSQGTASASSAAGESAGDYAREMETRLETLVGGIDGAGKTSVMVTLEQGTQYIYAKEEKKSQQSAEDKASGSVTKNQRNDSSETKYILVKGADGTEKALAVTEVQPTVKGVVVVCEGGGNPAVQQNIVSAVTTALSISSAHVCVVKSA